MGRSLWGVLAGVALACAFVSGGHLDAAAQGRGRGGGGGGGRGMGGPPAGVGVDRGMGRSSDASEGRADRGRGNASDRSQGRSDAGLERARMREENSRDADKELREHPGVAAGLHTTANDLRAGYRAALAANPNVTRDRILAGLASGRSIGQTLQDLGLSSQAAKDAERQANREIKESRRHS